MTPFLISGGDAHNPLDSEKDDFKSIQWISIISIQYFNNCYRNK